MKAFITGACGQDGYYLARELQEHGYSVYGLYHGQDESRLSRLQQELPGVEWVRGDVTDGSSMDAIIGRIQPDVVFNMAACSYVGQSWEMPRLHMTTNYGGLINVLEAVHRYAPEAHVVQASTSEMYGNTGGTLSETSPMVPASPYGVAKLAAHRLCKVYRDSYGMHVSSAISFNHESPRRPPLFVTRKVTQAAVEIAYGVRKTLELGDINSARDWGFAGDYARAYRLMAEADVADDYVVATGETHTIRDLLQTAFDIADAGDWREMVVTTAANLRPNDVRHLCGDATKIRERLGWFPHVTFTQLVQMMVAADRGAIARKEPVRI